MKRKISLIVIAVLLICMSQMVSVFAVPGEDAHSDTMTVEADGETVQEKQATEQDVIDEDVSEEELQAQLEDAAADEVENPEADDIGGRVWIIVGGAALLAVIGGAAVKSKNRGNYKSRH